MEIFEVLYLDHLIDKTEECFNKIMYGRQPRHGCVCYRVFQQVSIMEHMYVWQEDE